VILSMQAAADVTKKESSWSGWKGQGTDAFTVISSSVCLRCVAVREEGLLSPHVGQILMTPLVCIHERVCVCVRVCFACVHLPSNCICHALGESNGGVFSPAPPFPRTRPDD